MEPESTPDQILPRPSVGKKVLKIFGIIVAIAVIVFALLVRYGFTLEKQGSQDDSHGGAATSSAQENNASDTSQNDSDSMENYVGMETDAEGYKAFAYGVVAAVAKGDVQYLKDNFSPNAIAANPPGVFDSALLPAVRTFFADFDHVGNSVTIRPSTDSFGDSGYSFAMTAVYKDGSEKPFKVYVVEENGKLVVGNFIVTK